jgi:signal transduction histidine kinase
VVGDDAAVAAPPDGLGAHDRARVARRHLEELAQALAEQSGLRVVGVVVEALSLPAGVHRFPDALALRAKSAQRGEVDMRNSSPLERCRQRIEEQAPISAEEFRLLNLCLDDAMAEAVTEWGRLRERAIEGRGTERLGTLAHEMRNLLGTGMLAYQMLLRAQGEIGGSTCKVLGRSLTRLRDLIDRSLTDVRIDAGIERHERICVAEFLEEIEVGAGMEAQARRLHFKASPVDRAVTVQADRQILAAAVFNLLHNAFKFTRKGTTVDLRTDATAERVVFEVEDECGGLPPGKIEELFVAFSQRGRDRSGVGLGLSICLKAAKASGGEISARDVPGKGCVFTLNLPRNHPRDP